MRGNSLQQFTHTNVEGTQQLIEAMSQQPARPRLVMLSSLAAQQPELSWYSYSKRAGEDLLKESSLDWTVLRPPAVYGPGDKEMQPIFDWMARGIALVPGAIDARTSLIHVDDLVAAIVACLLTSECHGKIFTACDGKPGGYDWREMADIAETVWQRKVRLFAVPSWLLDGIAEANLRLARLSGRAAMLSPLKLRELRHPDWVVDNTSINSSTNWEPRLPLQAGLRALREAEL